MNLKKPPKKSPKIAKKKKKVFRRQNYENFQVHWLHLESTQVLKIFIRSFEFRKQTNRKIYDQKIYA